MKKLIIGLGTGRCGTTSLVKLLNIQHDSNFTHEMRTNNAIVLPWEPNYNLATECIESILTRKETYIGDVAFYWLNYIDFIFKNYYNSIDIKIIALKRNKEHTVNSFFKRSGIYNSWVNHNNIKREWDIAFPKYDNISKYDAISKYYDEYYKILNEKMKKYSNKIKIFKTEDLNDKLMVCEMLEYLEFSNPICETNIRKNIYLNQ